MQAAQSTNRPGSATNPGLLPLHRVHPAVLAAPSLAPAAAVVLGLTRVHEMGFEAALAGSLGLILAGVTISIAAVCAWRRQPEGAPSVGALTRTWAGIGAVQISAGGLSLPIGGAPIVAMDVHLLVAGTLTLALACYGVAALRAEVEPSEDRRPSPLWAAAWPPLVGLSIALLGLERAFGPLPMAPQLALCQLGLLVLLGSLTFGLHDLAPSGLSRALLLGLWPWIGAGSTRFFTGLEPLPNLAAAASMLELIAMLLPLAWALSLNAEIAEGEPPPLAERAAKTGATSEERGQGARVSAAATPAPAAPLEPVVALPGLRPALDPTPEGAPAPDFAPAAAREADELLALLLHELPDPLRRERKAAELLLDELDEVDDASLTNHARELRRSSGRAEAILAAVERIRAGEVALGEAVPLEVCFEEAARGFEPRLADGVRAMLPRELPEVRADRTCVALALRNLLLNFVEHRGALPALEVEREGDLLRLGFLDVDGSSTDDAPLATGPLRAEAARAKSPGQGLGISACLAERWGGSLDIDRRQDRTRVRLTLPVSTLSRDANRPRLLEVIR